MDIGIIGSGNIGGTSARLLADAGHLVLLSNSRGPESLSEVVGDLGPRVEAVTVEEAAARGEVVLVAIPFGRYRELPVAPLAGTIVIDAMNYYPSRDGAIPALDGGTTSSALLREHLRGARIVKAFNTIWSERLRTASRPAGDPRRLAIPLAGDDAEAKRVVAGLIDQIGFDPIDNGGLDEGGQRQQPGTPVYNQPLTAAQAREVLGLPQDG